MRNRPLCHVSLALACTLALPLASRGASPRVEALQTPPLPAEFADLPESGELSTPVLVSGSVITDDDTRLMGGDAVVVAMPRQEVIEKARGEGTGFNWTPVARATIGRDGSFTARPAPSVDLAENASKGFVDFQLWTRTGDRLGHFGFSRQVTADGELLPATAPDVPLPASDGRPYSLGSSLYGGAPVVQLVTEKAPTTGALGDDSPQPPPNGFDCEHRGQTNARRVAVGQLNHYARGVFGRFSYRVGSHSTMSYGLRVGTELSWHSGGTHTRSTHIEDTFRRTKGLQRYKYFGFWDYGFYLCRVDLAATRTRHLAVHRQRLRGRRQAAVGTAQAGDTVLHADLPRRTPHDDHAHRGEHVHEWGGCVARDRNRPVVAVRLRRADEALVSLHRRQPPALRHEEPARRGSPRLDRHPQRAVARARLRPPRQSERVPLRRPRPRHHRL